MGFTGKLFISPLTDTTLNNIPIENILKAESGYLKIIRLGKNVSLFSDSRLGLITTDLFTGLNISTYTFGGGYHPRFYNAVPFYGSLNYDYTFRNYFLTKLDVQYEVLSNLFITMGANYVSSKYPAEWLGIEYNPSDLIDTSYRLGFGMSVGYFSIIGPISVALSWDTQRKDIISNLNIGFYF